MTGCGEVARLKSQLDAAFDRAKRLAYVADLETQADFARYLCVLVSGYLEKSISELVLEHARQCGGPTMQRFVESIFDQVVTFGFRLVSEGANGRRTET